MQIHRGTTVETAIPITYKTYGQHNVEQIINEYIDQMFGSNDGNYMVLNSQHRTDLKGREFKILLVEDRDNVKHQVYFHLIPTEQKTTIQR